MNPATLERAIGAFCQAAGLPRDAVRAVVVGDRVAMWVRGNPIATWIPASPAPAAGPGLRVVSNA